MLVNDEEYFGHEFSDVDFVKSVNIRGGGFTIMSVFEGFQEPFYALHEAKYSIKQPKAKKRLVNSVKPF